MKRSRLSRVLSKSIVSAILIIGMNNIGYSSQKIYDFKSAEIELKTVDPMSNIIKETVLVDEWGVYESRHSFSTIKMLGIEKKQESIIYTDRKENVVYQYDPKMNQATKLAIDEVLDSKNKGNKQYVYNEESLEQWGGKKIGTEDFLGLKCDVVEFSEFFTTVWFHKKFPVKSVTNMGAMKVKTEAVRFKEGVSITKKDVTLPAGVEIVDAPDIGKIMSRMNAHKNMPGNQESPRDNQESERDEHDTSNETDSGEMPDMKEVMEAMKKMFGNQDQ